MITTVTLNPAVDKTYETARLLPGQVNRMDSIRNIAGGKGINVTKVLRQYGYPVKALGFMGGYSGKLIEDYVKSIGAECRFTHVAGETRSSINILAQDGYVTEILEPGPVISEKELSLFFKAYEREIADSSYVILSGSAPAGVGTSIYAELIRRAKLQDKKVLLDSSGAYLQEGIQELPFMVKPNRRELETLAKRKLTKEEEIMEAALFLYRKGIAHVLVSLGEKGMIYVGSGVVMRAKAPKIKALNTVGCGDSAVAAFAMACERELESEEMLKLCAGISAANALTLESAVIDQKAAEELEESVEIVHRAPIK